MASDLPVMLCCFSQKLCGYLVSKLVMVVEKVCKGHGSGRNPYAMAKVVASFGPG